MENALTTPVNREYENENWKCPEWQYWFFQISIISQVLKLFVPDWHSTQHSQQSRYVTFPLITLAYISVLAWVKWNECSHLTKTQYLFAHCFQFVNLLQSLNLLSSYLQARCDRIRWIPTLVQFTTHRNMPPKERNIAMMGARSVGRFLLFTFGT